MPIDKIFISHVVSELIIIIGVSFYYHKKCSYLQSQIQDLNNKLEKLNVNNYLSLIERQKHFEQQTVQHINKIYSLLNSRNSLQENQNVYNNQYSSNFSKDNIISNSQKYENMIFNPDRITEGFSLNGTKDTLNINSIEKTQPPIEKKAQTQNPFLNTLSMIGPLSTMFQVVMDKKPPHPDELFKNLNIDNTKGTKKIVEIEDDTNEQVDTTTLDMELADELNELKSSVTAVNTPVLIPRTPKRGITENILTPDKCENGICKIDFSTSDRHPISERALTFDIHPMSPVNIVDNTRSNLTLTQNDMEKIESETSKIEMHDKTPSSQSSPLRYISHVPEQKRGRPKKIN